MINFQTHYILLLSKNVDTEVYTYDMTVPNSQI